MVRSDGITTQHTQSTLVYVLYPPRVPLEPRMEHPQENGPFFGVNPPPAAANHNTPSSEDVIVENRNSFRARYAADIRTVALRSLCLVALTQPNAGMVFTAHQVHRRRKEDVEVPVRKAPKKGNFEERCKKKRKIGPQQLSTSLHDKCRMTGPIKHWPSS